MGEAGPISSNKNTAEPVSCPIAHWTGGPEAQILALIGAAVLAITLIDFLRTVDAVITAGRTGPPASQ